MIQSSFPASARADFLAGVHQQAHTYRLALYTSDANIGPATVAYTARGEVRGPGYTAGGIRLAGRVVGSDKQGRAVLTFVQPARIENCTITARGAIVYNDSAEGKPVLCVLDFGSDVRSANGPFSVDFGDALITLE